MTLPGCTTVVPVGGPVASQRDSRFPLRGSTGFYAGTPRFIALGETPNLLRYSVAKVVELRNPNRDATSRTFSRPSSSARRA